jgi:hypothetical protein
MGFFLGFDYWELLSPWAKIEKNGYHFEKEVHVIGMLRLNRYMYNS